MLVLKHEPGKRVAVFSGLRFCGWMEITGPKREHLGLDFDGEFTFLREGLLEGERLALATAYDERKRERKRRARV